MGGSSTLPANLRPLINRSHTIFVTISRRLASKMLTHLTTLACLLGTILAQLPPSYTLAKTNTALGVRYDNTDVKPGQTLAYNGIPPTIPPYSIPQY